MNTVRVPLSFSLCVTLRGRGSPVPLRASFLVSVCNGQSDSSSQFHISCALPTNHHPLYFPACQSVTASRPVSAGRVQLGSTNTWLSIRLLVCAGMVFLFLCLFCFLLHLLSIFRHVKRKLNIFEIIHMDGHTRHKRRLRVILYCELYGGFPQISAQLDHLKYLPCHV